MTALWQLSRTWEPTRGAMEAVEGPAALGADVGGVD